MNIAGEWVWRIPSLSLPDPSAGADAIAQSDAVRLFVERARSASATVSDDQLSDVAAICRRLDGIPLAIELAAARARAISPRQLLERLDDAFRVLVSTGRGTLPRQQTLRAAIEWSHDLLSETERVLFRRLAVFVGSFALDAVEVACSDDQVDQLLVVDLVTSLVDRSVVVVDAAETRYRLLETVRQFAAEQLERAGEVEMLRDRHLAWCNELAGALQDSLTIGGDHGALRRADAEESNMQAALAWAADRDAPAGEELAAHLTFYWFARARMNEPVYWLRTFLGDDDSIDSPDRLRLLLGAAMALREAGGSSDTIRSWAQRGAAMASRLDDQRAAAYSLGTLALLPGPDRVDLAREAIEVARRSGDNGAWMWTSGAAARAFGDEGRYDEATRQLDEMRSRIGPDTRSVARSTLLLGEADLFLLTGQLANAVKAASGALAVMAEEFDEQNALLGLIALGATSLAVADLDAAYDAYARAFEISRRVSDIGSQGIALSGLAAISANRSQFETSARVLGTALVIPRSPGARATTRYGYEVAERLDRDALGDRYDQFLADGAVLAPDEAAALVGIYH